MNKKFVVSFLALSALCLPTAVDASTHRPSHSKHDYNCRMPRRDQRPGINENDECYRLFRDLGLDSYQYRKAKRAYAKYNHEINEIQRKLYHARPDKAEKYQRQTMKCQDKFLNEIRRILSVGQYKMFEARFLGYPANSMPRPGSCCNNGPSDGNVYNGGNWIGPVSPGPQPALMTTKKH